MNSNATLKDSKGSIATLAYDPRIIQRTDKTFKEVNLRIKIANVILSGRNF
jgi:hypothetical protein